jgi:G patch domain-containing protein 1
LFFQAFGVGAFEDDDEDIYSREDMLQYDFTLDTEPTTSKQKQQITKVASADYTGCSLIGFILGTNVLTCKKYFPPPILPHGFQPVHVSRQSRFQPAPTERASLNNEEESLISKRKGLQRHNLTATDRAQILNEPAQKSTALKDTIKSPTQQENKKLSAEEIKTQKLEVSATEGCSQFRPFVAHPEKQKRYEQYLTLCKVGQKGTVA